LPEETATFMLLMMMISFEVENHITMEDVMAVEQLVFRLRRNVCSELGKRVCFYRIIVWLLGWLKLQPPAPGHFSESFFKSGFFKCASYPGEAYSQSGK
jgi:hypothetical protein